MTTIKPRLGGINLDVKHVDSEGYALIQIGDLPKQVPGMRTVSVAARYPMADLLAALDAVPESKLFEAGEAYAKLTETATSLSGRGRTPSAPTKAEAKLAEAEAERDDAIDARDSLWKERDALAATVERVREATAIWGDSQFRAAVLAALDPKPAFVLPTEVPARIEAKREHFGWTGDLDLWSNGEKRFWRCEYDGQDYTPDGVMELFTDHRLLGAAE